jgi:hypothetical protein
VSGDTNEEPDVFVHDRLTGQTWRVSIASDGAQGDNASRDPSISGDGVLVAFQSHARNLVSDDTSVFSDIFVHERELKAIYLPLIFQDHRYCGRESLTNGNFEQDEAGWELFTSGTDWKAHDLVGSQDEGFSPYAGDYAARLGGYEGVWDTIEQTVIFPTHGRLTYWWKMGTYETLPHTDWFSVDLLQIDGTKVAHLAFHDDQDLEGVWQQDQVDVTAFAGQELVLRFASSNDNYYFSWFDLDEVSLCGP